MCPGIKCTNANNKQNAYVMLHIHISRHCMFSDSGVTLQAFFVQGFKTCLSQVCKKRHQI